MWVCLLVLRGQWRSFMLRGVEGVVYDDCTDRWVPHPLRMFVDAEVRVLGQSAVGVVAVDVEELAQAAGQ